MYAYVRVSESIFLILILVYALNIFDKLLLFKEFLSNEFFLLYLVSVFYCVFSLSKFVLFCDFERMQKLSLVSFISLCCVTYTIFHANGRKLPHYYLPSLCLLQPCRHPKTIVKSFPFTIENSCVNSFIFPIHQHILHTIVLLVTIFCFVFTRKHHKTGLKLGKTFVVYYV